MNGTEIQNYKSGDVILFGGINSIDVLFGGSNYDVISPPDVVIESTVGTGASATANVKGQFTRFDIIDPGFDYTEEPDIEITGGNGKNAVARAVLRQIDHFVDFDVPLQVEELIFQTILLDLVHITNSEMVKL